MGVATQPSRSLNGLLIAVLAVTTLTTDQPPRGYKPTTGLTQKGQVALGLLGVLDAAALKGLVGATPKADAVLDYLTPPRAVSNGPGGYKKELLQPRLTERLPPNY